MQRSFTVTKTLIIGLVLAASVLIVYGPVYRFEFLALDDNIYVTENRHVREGLSGGNLLWAFTTTDTTNWHPLTWFSLLADSSLYGLNAGGYHVTSLLLHAANCCLLFLVLFRMTGTYFCSALVAALFAVHPVNVESVAWVAERKNVLSTFFLFTTLWAYTDYVSHPGRRRYLLVMILFAAGLLSKPMVVTLPALLLLLDYWPLGRFARPHGQGRKPDTVTEKPLQTMTAAQLVREKIPFIVLALLMACVTLYVAEKGGAVKALSAFPLEGRIANALVSYVEYLQKLVWPSGMAFFYPWRKLVPWPQLLFSAVLLIGMTAFAVRCAGRRPYVFVGWLWYLVTLVPVIGVVQVGYQAMADRYAYVPAIGIFVIAVWGARDLLSKSTHRRVIQTGLFLAVILVYGAVSVNQVRHWRNSETVFRRGLETTRDNHMAHQGMGHVYLLRGDHERAEAHFREALRIRPGYTDAAINLGIVLMRQNRFGEAVEQYRRLLEDHPQDARILNDLGVALACIGRHEEAARRFREALERDPEHRDARENLGKALQEMERAIKK